MQKHSICTLAAALTLAMHGGYAHAASHCQGLEEQVCGSTVACRWAAAAKAGDPTKAGTPRKRDVKAHCRLDIKAAAKLAADISAKK